MAILEECGRREIHLPHEYTPEEGYHWSTYICAGEIEPGHLVKGALQLVLTAAMAVADDATGSYTDDHIEGVVNYRISEAFKEFASTIRGMIESAS